jgi:hypothetical protein
MPNLKDSRGPAKDVIPYARPVKHPKGQAFILSLVWNVKNARFSVSASNVIKQCSLPTWL